MAYFLREFIDSFVDGVVLVVGLFLVADAWVRNLGKGPPRGCGGGDRMCNLGK